jgi:hypothetical protein
LARNRAVWKISKAIIKRRTQTAKSSGNTLAARRVEAHCEDNRRSIKNVPLKPRAHRAVNLGRNEGIEQNADYCRNSITAKKRKQPKRVKND